MTSSPRPRFENSLAGRVAVVTGASSGIGAATGKALAARGAKVALIARRADRLTKLVDEIKAAGGTASAYSVDITDGASLEKAAIQIRTDLGTPGILINNAGVMLPAPIVENRVDDWSRMIDLNVTALVRSIGVFSGDLIKAAKAQGGADLVNISSMASTGIFPGFAVYCATKAAVSHLSRNLRTELNPQLVRVSVMEPGIVMSELLDHVTDQGARDWVNHARQTYKVLDSEDVAEVLAFQVALPPHVNLDHVGIQPTQQV